MTKHERLQKAIKAMKVATRHLEIIAKMESLPTVSPEDGESQKSVIARQYLEAMKANSHKLSGRMTSLEIQDAIGMKLRHGDRGAFGHAIDLYGAKKSRTRTTRYYTFD